MHLIPSFNQKGNIESGSFIQALSFCKNCYSDNRCMKHYKDLMSEQESCFKICPYGLVSYIFVHNDKKIIFTSLRERSLYKKQNKKFAKEMVYNPVLGKEQFLILIENSLTKQSEQENLKHKEESFDSMAHEVKKLNSQIKEYCDSIINLYSEKNDYMSLTTEEYLGLFEKIKSLYIISNMITSRYTIYDYDKNPEILSSGSKIRVSIHGKFMKCSKILKNYKKKKVHINFDGETHKYINAYSSFEMIPFLLLENAEKYALESTEINVNFIDSYDSLKLEIISYSPYCSKDDLTKIFEKGFRGKNARKISDGNGIGLYFVKLLCDLHKILINVESDSESINEIEKIPYSNFRVILTFTDVFEKE